MPVRIFVATALLLLAPWPAASGDAPGAGDVVAAERDGPPLDAVLRRRRDVFAARPDGLYRAALSDHRWVKLPIPGTMPLGGQFGKVPADGGTILYHSLSGKKPPAGTVPGLYA